MLFFISLFFIFSTADLNAAEPICSRADIAYCDDFEDGNWILPSASRPLSRLWDPTGYCCDTNQNGKIDFNFPPANNYEERNAVHCGSGKGFQDNCAAQSGSDKVSGSGGGYWAHSPSMGTSSKTELYMRWYLYLTNPFVFDNSGDKSLLFEGPGGFQLFLNISEGNGDGVTPGDGIPMLASYTNDRYACGNQPTAIGGHYYSCAIRHQNQGNNLKLEQGNWYLFEWYVRLNTVGMSNGETKLWIDKVQPGVAVTQQTLRMHYTDMTFRDAAGMAINQIWLTPYMNSTGRNGGADPPLPPKAPFQHQSWDNIVVGTSPIGPMPKSGTPADTQPPVTPKNLRAVP